MAKQSTHSHRRNLAPPLLSEPKTSMDPTVPKKHPNSKPMSMSMSSSSSTTSTTKPHPTPQDPILPSSTTIHNISHHFAKLYSGHKGLASLKGSTAHSHPQIDTHLQAKGLSSSTVLDTSCIALTKSNSQHGRRVVAADSGKVGTRTKVKEKYHKSLLIKKSSHQEVVVDVEKALARQKFNEVKKSVQKEWKKEEIYEERDVKKASILMSKSLEIEELKRSNEVSEMKRPSISLAMNGGGRRRSFCCSQTELADFFSCTGVKVVAVDMPPFMQIHAVDCARKAYDSLEKFTSKTLALTLKKEFDGVYGPAWHCIVGTSFGSFVTHSVGGFMYFSMDQKLYILLFKTTVQRAD